MKKSLSIEVGNVKEAVPIFHTLLFRRSILIIAVLHLILFWGYSFPKRFLRTDRNRDLVAYYLVIERIDHNEPLYSISSEIGPHSPKLPTYIYPPVLSNILAVFPPINFPLFAKIWTAILYISFWIYAMCLLKMTGCRITFSGTIISGMFLTLFPGTHRALSLGQIDPVLWALFGVAIISPSIRGGGLMAVALVKPWAIWPFLWSVKEGRKVLIGAFVVVVGSLILGIIMRGPVDYYSEWLTWFNDILPRLGQGSWSIRNWSLSFGALRLIRLLGIWEYSGGMFPLWSRLWLVSCGIAAPIFVGILFRNKQKTLQLSAIGSSAVIFSPICWIHYLPILLTVLMPLLGNSIRLNEKGNHYLNTDKT